MVKKRKTVDTTTYFYIKWLLLILICFGIVSCQKKDRPIKRDIKSISNSIKKEAERPSKKQYKYLAESALLSMYQGEYIEAHNEFEKAYQLYQSLYQKSLSELTLSKLINEKVKTFRPHYLEQWQLRWMAIINQFLLKSQEGALIETRRLSRILRAEGLHDEKISVPARQSYLCWTGFFFCLLNRPEEGIPDLKHAENIKPETFSETLVTVLPKLKSPSGAVKQENDLKEMSSLHKPGHELHLNIYFHEQSPQKIEQGFSLSLVNDWPIIHGYLKGNQKHEKEAVEIENFMLGVLGKKVVRISYAIFESPQIHQSKRASLAFGNMLIDSWNIQKNRLIAQSFLRVAYKMYAAHKVEENIKSSIQQPWGELIGHIGRTLLWQTERADLRQISYLPSFIELDFKWKKAEGFSLQSQIAENKILHIFAK